MFFLLQPCETKTSAKTKKKIFVIIGTYHNLQRVIKQVMANDYFARFIKIVLKFYGEVSASINQ